MLVSLQLVALAFVPLKVTVLEPCEDPKLEPAMVTAVPPVPDVGLRLLILGLAAVKMTLLAPELELGVPSGVEMVTGSCAFPDAVLATLTVTSNAGAAVARPAIEAELVQVTFCPEALQLQVPAVMEV